MLKRILKVLAVITVICSQLIINQVNALSFNVSCVNNGNGTVTVTVSGDVVGTFSAQVGSATASGLAIRVPGGSDSRTLTTGAGTFNVSVTGTMSDRNHVNDAGAYIPFTETYTSTVTVTVPSNPNGSSGGSGGIPANQPSDSSAPTETPSSSTTTQTKEEETPKSSNNNLSSITLDHGDLQPAFNPNTTDYTVDLDYTYTSIHVEASVEDSKASIIQGTGDHELNEGDNSIAIVVQAEDHSVKTYNINVKVQASPDLTLKLDNEDYKVISNYKDVTLPETFEDSKITINDVEVRCVRSQTYNLVLLYLNKGDENKFYIYDEASNKVLGEYVTLSYNEKTYVVYPVDEGQKNKKGFIFTTMTIQDKEIAGWKYEDEKEADFFVVYLVNDQGAKEYYRYDTVENSLQRLESEPTIVQDQLDPVIFYVIGGAVALVVLGILGYVFISKKRKVQFERRGKLQEEEYEFSQEEVEDDED